MVLLMHLLSYPVPRDVFSTQTRFFFKCYVPHRDLHSFPTRRSSDLTPRPKRNNHETNHSGRCPDRLLVRRLARGGQAGDRKSTRLNSSHITISYAVFCLKKKKKRIVE